MVLYILGNIDFIAGVNTLNLAGKRTSGLCLGYYLYGKSGRDFNVLKEGSIFALLEYSR